MLCLYEEGEIVMLCMFTVDHATSRWMAVGRLGRSSRFWCERPDRRLQRRDVSDQSDHGRFYRLWCECPVSDEKGSLNMSVVFTLKNVTFLLGFYDFWVNFGLVC